MGLIILRFALAFSGIDHGVRAMTAPGGAPWEPRFLGLFATLTGVALLLGFLTPVAGVLTSLGYLVNGLSLFISEDFAKHSGDIQVLNLFVMSLALVLLGPGAFSVDARLFGHREIILPDRGRSRHQRPKHSHRQ